MMNACYSFQKMVPKAFIQAQISDKIKENLDFLRKLARSKSERKRKQLLKHASTVQLLAIAEICLNIVSARFKLTTRQKKRLMPYADFVRRASRLRSERGAKKLIVQKGSGIGGVFAALLTPVLLELARNVIKGKSSTEDSS